jgi:ATP-binding cassette subfamily F protein 3
MPQTAWVGFIEATSLSHALPDGRLLFSGANLRVGEGAKAALVGANGTGKTTLIETLAGQRELAKGKLSIGHNVKLGYLSQHAEELGAGGHPGQTVLEVAQRATGLTPGKARALLGGFLFSGDEAEKPLEGLSGGERRRLSLAVLVSSGANVLILDEPTNHLDIESREALEDALRSFEGALILVSHDRALLDAVGTRTVAVEEGALHSYAGGWPEYVRVREERRAQGTDGARQQTARPSRARLAEDSEPKATKPKPKSPSKNRLNQTEQAERGVEEAERALNDLEAELTDPAAWATRYESAKSEARHTAAKIAVERAYTELEALYE